MARRGAVVAGCVLGFLLGAAGLGAAEEPRATLVPVPWDLLKQRWSDIIPNPYDASMEDPQHYYGPGVLVYVDYFATAPTFAGTLHAMGLKPNFAYQLKLNGKPSEPAPGCGHGWADGDDWANERLGYAGRWWMKKLRLSDWSVVSQGNSTDSQYGRWKRRGFTDGTYYYYFEGYLLFDWIVTDGDGVVTKDLWLNSSLHVLWKTSARTPAPNDAAPTTHVIVADESSPWYGQTYQTKTEGVYGEWEPGRPLPGELVLLDGSYDVRLFLTEESFHEADGDWATVMACDEVAFTVGTTPPPNTPPVAVDDSHTTTQETTLNVPAPGVLGNDTDADGDPLTAALVAQPSNGTVTLNADGSFSYTPNPDFTGDDSFTYKANDGTDDSNIATVSITVEVPAPPDVSGTITLDVGSPLSGIRVKLYILSRGRWKTVASSTTDAEGTYAFDGLEAPQRYWVEPRSKAYTFTPVEADSDEFVFEDEPKTIDFTASLAEKAPRSKALAEF